MFPSFSLITLSVFGEIEINKIIIIYHEKQYYYYFTLNMMFYILIFEIKFVEKFIISVTIMMNIQLELACMRLNKV